MKIEKKTIQYFLCIFSKTKYENLSEENILLPKRVYIVSNLFLTKLNVLFIAPN